MGEAMSRRIRGVFNAANFWAIVLYNVLSLNSLEFAKLVGRRLIFKGKKKKGCILFLAKSEGECSTILQ